MKVWMLTGDKGETARNIGQTCGIIDESMEVFELKEDGEILDELQILLKKMKDPRIKDRFTNRMSLPVTIRKSQLSQVTDHFKYIE